MRLSFASKVGALTLLSQLVGVAPALAQPPTIPPVPIISPTGGIQGLAQRVVGWILLIAGIVAVLFLIWGGFQYLTAGGNAEQAQKAKTTIINSVIGIVIIALSYFIYNAVLDVLR